MSRQLGWWNSHMAKTYSKPPTSDY
jgi:hypothetical protein